MQEAEAPKETKATWWMIAVVGSLSTLISVTQIFSEWNAFDTYHRIQAVAMVLFLCLLPVSIVRSIRRNKNIEPLLVLSPYFILMLAVTTFGR